jgi:hypothetical protein
MEIKKKPKTANQKQQTNKIENKGVNKKLINTANKRKRKKSWK